MRRFCGGEDGMNVFEEFQDVLRLMQARGLRYALVSGVAMAFHDEARFTRDIDLLLHPENLENLKDALSEIGYSESATPWSLGNPDVTLHRFMRIEEPDYMQLDVLTANDKRTRQIVKDSLKAESENWDKRTMTRIDRTLKELSALYELNRMIEGCRLESQGEQRKTECGECKERKNGGQAR
jgi:hypothetical protein